MADQSYEFEDSALYETVSIDLPDSEETQIIDREEDQVSLVHSRAWVLCKAFD